MHHRVLVRYRLRHLQPPNSPLVPYTTLFRSDFGTLESVKEKVVIWCQRYVGEPVFIHQPEKIVRVEQELKEYFAGRSEEHTSELQSRGHLVCRLLLEKKIPSLVQSVNLNHDT